jgi:hypothetical protein
MQHGRIDLTAIQALAAVMLLGLAAAANAQTAAQKAAPSPATQSVTATPAAKPLPREISKPVQQKRLPPTALDAVSDVGSIESQKMQQDMGRRSKALETLSNLQKKQSAAAASAVQNMK